MDAIAMLVVTPYLLICGVMAIGLFIGLLLKWLQKVFD